MEGGIQPQLAHAGPAALWTESSVGGRTAVRVSVSSGRVHPDGEEMGNVLSCPGQLMFSGSRKQTPRWRADISSAHKLIPAPGSWVT